MPTTKPAVYSYTNPVTGMSYTWSNGVVSYQNSAGQTITYNDPLGLFKSGTLPFQPGLPAEPVQAPVGSAPQPQYTNTDFGNFAEPNYQTHAGGIYQPPPPVPPPPKITPPPSPGPIGTVGGKSPPGLNPPGGGPIGTIGGSPPPVLLPPGGGPIGPPDATHKVQPEATHKVQPEATHKVQPETNNTNAQNYWNSVYQKQPNTTGAGMASTRGTQLANSYAKAPNTALGTSGMQIPKGTPAAPIGAPVAAVGR